jgi:hypothetical protein
MTAFEVSREVFDVDHRFVDIDGARIRSLPIVEAAPAVELDTIVEGPPLWPPMEAHVTPLTTRDDRKQALRARQSA